MKYLLIGHSYPYYKRGTITIPKRFAREYPQYIDFIEDTQIKNLKEISKQYDKIILCNQVPSNYTFRVNPVSLNDINYLLYIRQEHNWKFYNSCNNGFHYYRSYPSIKYFTPLITNFKLPDRKINNICIGFYLRRNVNPDSYKYAIDIMKTLSGFKFYTMGDKSTELPWIKHTYDNIKFFSNITHYIYPASKLFKDPSPQSVLEAIQNEIQIIFPEIQGRNHKDGIDDFKECIKWHEKFNPNIYYDNSDCPLTSEIFKQFYLNLFENNFEYSFDRNKYKSFSKWIENEIL